MSSELLPCPFCGAQPVLMFNSIVECRNCPTSFSSGYTTANISAWQKRAPMELSDSDFLPCPRCETNHGVRVMHIGDFHHEGAKVWCERCELTYIFTKAWFSSGRANPIPPECYKAWNSEVRSMLAERSGE